MRCLFRKYYIEKADGTPVKDNKFVLSPEKDRASLEALKTFARETDNEELRKDLEQWIFRIEMNSI